MSIPLIIFLGIYLAVGAIFIIFAFFNIYHGWRFGFWDQKNFVVMVVYMVSLLVILFFSGLFISGTDWTQTLDIFYDMPSPVF